MTTHKIFDPEVLSKLTPADRAALEKFERDEAFAEGQLVSLEWLATDAGCNYISNRTNAKLMGEWIKENGNPPGEWTEANLNDAMRATQHLHVERDPDPVVEVPPTPPPQPPTPEQMFGPWCELTKDQVIKMDGKEMRQASRDPRFIAKVNSLKITKADLAAKE
jgi:hypothetical protein